MNPRLCNLLLAATLVLVAVVLSVDPKHPSWEIKDVADLTPDEKKKVEAQYKGKIPGDVKKVNVTYDAPTTPAPKGKKIKKPPQELPDQSRTVPTEKPKGKKEKKDKKYPTGRVKLANGKCQLLPDEKKAERPTQYYFNCENNRWLSEMEQKNENKPGEGSEGPEGQKTDSPKPGDSSIPDSKSSPKADKNKDKASPKSKDQAASPPASDQSSGPKDKKEKKDKKYPTGRVKLANGKCQLLPDEKKAERPTKYYFNCENNRWLSEMEHKNKNKPGEGSEGPEGQKTDSPKPGDSSKPDSKDSPKPDSKSSPKADKNKDKVSPKSKDQAASPPASDQSSGSQSDSKAGKESQKPQRRRR